MVAEIQFKLHERGYLQQFVPQLLELLGESVSHLFQCQSVRGGTRGCNKIRYCLRLAQVHLPIKESSLRVFSGSCQLASFLKQQLQYALEDIWGIVAGYFRSIFPCIGMWGVEYRYQYIVYGVAFRIDYLSKGEGVCFHLAQFVAFHWAEYVVCIGDGV